MSCKCEQCKRDYLIVANNSKELLRLMREIVKIMDVISKSATIKVEVQNEQSGISPNQG